MNKKIICAGIVSTLLLGSSIDANAFYIGAGLGSSKTKVEKTSLDNDTAFTLSGGFKIPLPLIPIRAEVEYSQLKSDRDDIDATTRGIGANAYVGLPLIPIVKPYLGFGLGYMQQKISGLGKSDWTLTPQYMVGLDLDLPLIPFAGGVEYRYIDNDFKGFRGDAELSSKIHAVLVKGRFYF